MLYAPINIQLKQPLQVKDSLSLPYPEGRNEGHFFGATNHIMAIDGVFFRSPMDFTLIPQPDRIIFIWNGAATLPKGTVLNIQAEMPGGNYYFDPKTSTTVLNMVPAPLFMVNLSSPRAADAQYWVKSGSVPDKQPLTLAHTQIETARNVVIHSEGDNSHTTFIIEGEDLYHRPVMEKIPAPATGMTEGKKAFAHIQRIISTHPCNGKLSIGTGKKLGLPVFLPAAGYLLREIINGIAVTGGTVVVGELTVPSATTGDRRGTYTPPAQIALDGKHSIHLLLSLLMPGNIGTLDYTG